MRLLNSSSIKYTDNSMSTLMTNHLSGRLPSSHFRSQQMPIALQFRVYCNDQTLESSLNYALGLTPLWHVEIQFSGCIQTWTAERADTKRLSCQGCTSQRLGAQGANVPEISESY